MTALFIYVCLAIFISFLCSLLEAAILSVTPTQIGLLKKQEAKAADLLEKYKEDINRPLSSILTINTAANMIGAAGVGAEVSKIYGDAFLGLASGLLTLSILIFSEIIPKTIGARYAVMIVPFGAYIILFMSWLTYPFVIMAEKIVRLLPSPDNRRGQEKEELIVSAEMGKTRGSLEEKEGDMLKNLLTLDRLSVADIMTPRSEVTGYQKDLSVQEVLTKERTIRYSRFPVYGEDFDDIIGVVHRYKVIEAEWNGHLDVKMSDLCSNVYFISQSLSVANALKQFIKTKQHLFIVIDSYGATSGILTLEDAIECLLGEEIVDEYDPEEEKPHLEIVQKGENKFIIKSRGDL
tara:strand:+ start:3995 stop:5044 length:1050 start_codon:yes stop_codon:yes gene_type:complete